MVYPDRLRVSFLYAHALRRFLPLARLRLITLRPPGVDMRALKPCFFLRRRLFGWKVRFIVKCLQIKKLSKKTKLSIDPVFVNNTSFNDLLN